MRWSLDRNTPAKDLFASSGFTLGDDGAWHLEPDAPRPNDRIGLGFCGANSACVVVLQTLPIVSTV
jgi:hypothetical protein